MPGADEDPDLAEVKAVLQKLQRLDLAKASDLEPGREDAGKTRKAPERAGQSGAQSLRLFEKKRAAITAGRDAARAPRRFASVYLLIAVAIVAGAVLARWLGAKIPAETRTGVPWTATVLQDRDAEIRQLNEARNLLNEGDTKAVRALLLRAGAGQSAGLALLLAQTYDPNFLRTLAQSNGLPDRAEAERWYRTWYELAVRSGLEMDSGRLQRIINAMQ